MRNSIHRRRFLKGLSGSFLALPLLEANSASGGTVSPKRITATGIFYGLVPGNFHPAQTVAAELLWVVAMMKLFSVLLVGTLLAGCERPASLTQADREAVLQIDDLVLWIEDFSPDASKESLKKTKDFDNSYYVEYEYDDSLNEEALYLSYDVSLQPTKWDASLIYQSQKFGANLGLFGEDSKQVPRNDLFRWGDESNFSLLQFEDGISFGNLFVARKGKRVVMLVLSGVYFDRSEDVHDLLDEKLEALERLPAP